jgi:TolA-binding protein
MMSRTPTVLLAALLLVAMSACGDDSGGSADPASLSSCESLADASIDLLQDTLDIIDSMSAEDLAAMGTSEDTPPELAAIETRGTALEERAEDLGCTEEQMSALMTARVDDLSSDSVFGQFLIESIRSGEGGFFEG